MTTPFSFYKQPLFWALRTDLGPNFKQQITDFSKKWQKKVKNGQFRQKIKKFYNQNFVPILEKKVVYKIKKVYMDVVPTHQITGSAGGIDLIFNLARQHFIRYKCAKL